MRYRNLCTFPLERTKVTFPWAWFDDVISSEEAEKIIAHCSNGETKPGVTLGPTTDRRVCKLAFHAWTPETAWFFERLMDRLSDMNNRWFGFDLNGFENFQYTEYRAEEAGKYDWHMDMCMGNAHLPAEMIEPRKLSMTLLLNDDFKGGEFQINQGCEDEAQTVELKRGRMVGFPSWMIHRVLPVTEGVRRSIVVWVTGPKFT